VPYYDPRIVYGPWWWPAYQPIVWTPWPGYARPYRPGVSVGFWWGRPVNLSVNFFFGNFDWHHRHVRVVHPTVYYRRPPVALNRTVVVAPHRWQHEPRQRATFYQRRERQQSRPQSNALPSVQVRPPVQGQPQPRARMPEAVAPQQPRAERHAPRHEPRNERLHKGGDRS